MGFTLQSYRDKLRIDLKDSGTLWSDAELNRCVQRAVDDLSRFLPLELVHDITFDYDVDDEAFTTPATASATALVNAHNIFAETDGATLTITDLTPEVPRRLTVTLNDADYSISQLTLIVKGYDQNGYYIEESWHLSDLRVSGTAYQGKLYFSRISQVELDNIHGATAADTISVGTGNAYDSYIFLANKPIRPESETVTDAAAASYTRDTDYTMDYANGAIKFINGGDMEAGTAYTISYDKSRIGVNIGDLLPILTRIQNVYYPADLIPQQKVSYNIIGDFMYIGSQKSGESQQSLLANKHIHIYYERKHMLPGEDSPGSYPGVLDEVICTGAGAYALLMMALKYEHQAVTDIAYVDTALDKVTVEMASVDAEFVDAATTWTEEVKHILSDDLPNMQDLLELGDDYINALGNTADPAEGYRRYAEAAYLMARTWEQKRQDVFTEVARLLDKSNMWLGEGQARIANANQYLGIAAGWRQEGLERRNEFWSILRDKSEYRKRVSSTPTTQPA